jgi:hypothetical protein
MQQDLVVRGLSAHTQRAYLFFVTDLTRYHRRSPDQLSDRDVQRYVRHLIEERRLAVSAVRHTWGQNLSQHVHLHCVVTGGGLTPDGQRWVNARAGVLFPVRALSQVFRGKFSWPACASCARAPRAPLRGRQCRPR